MRIQARYSDAWLRNTEASDQIMLDDAQLLLQSIARNGTCDVFRRQVGGGAGYPHPPAGEHHDGPSVCQLREIFSVTSKSNAGIIDDTFVHRRRYHRLKLTIAASGNSPLERLQHIGRIS